MTYIVPNSFVSFARREDAAAALDALQGEEIHGAEIKLGWGKALPKAPQIAVDAVLAKYGLPSDSSSGEVDIFKSTHVPISRDEPQTKIVFPKDTKVRKI